LLQEWVIISDVTGTRPWSGETAGITENDLPAFDPECYLCPGVERASGVQNPRYSKPFTFTNDFPSFSVDAAKNRKEDILERVEPANGICRVTCFSPLHNITLPELTVEQIKGLLGHWKEEYKTLGSKKEIDNVLIFENRGKITGASNPHPHGQIYATGFVPRIVKQEFDSFVQYNSRQGTCILCDIAAREAAEQDRVICENGHFIAFILFFARFAYETYLVPKRHIADISELSEAEIHAFAELYKTVLVKFDNLYEFPFPNITVLHNAPTNGAKGRNAFHFHVEFYPPLRSPDKQKYLAGFEAGGGNIINPLLPEKAALQLRQTDTIHYKTREKEPG